MFASASSLGQVLEEAGWYAPGKPEASDLSLSGASIALVLSAACKASSVHPRYYGLPEASLLPGPTREVHNVSSELWLKIKMTGELLKVPTTSISESRGGED